MCLLVLNLDDPGMAREIRMELRAESLRCEEGRNALTLTGADLQQAAALGNQVIAQAKRQGPVGGQTVSTGAQRETGLPVAHVWGHILQLGGGEIGWV